MDSVRALAVSQRGVIGAGPLRTMMHPREIEGALRAGVLHRLWRGAYCVDPPGDDGRHSVRTRMTAAAMTLGEVVAACLETAAEFHGFQADVVRDTHVRTSGSSLSTRPGLVVHRHRPIAASTLIDGHLVEDPAECAVRLAARQDSPAAVLAVLDAALHRGAVEGVDVLVARSRALAGRGVHLLRKLAPLADAAARCAAHSWIRWTCLDRALDLPVIAGNVESRPAAALADPDYTWHRYRMSMSLVAADDPALRRTTTHGAQWDAGDWTHLLLEHASGHGSLVGACPVHPAALARLLSALAVARRRTRQICDRVGAVAAPRPGTPWSSAGR